MVTHLTCYSLLCGLDVTVLSVMGTKGDAVLFNAEDHHLMPAQL